MSEIKNEETFEESLNKLEKIAQNMERGDLSLDEAMAEFERGIKLSKECTRKIEEAEKKINILIKNENGDFEEQSFEAE